MRTSVWAKPCTVASGVRRSWHASMTRRGNCGSSGKGGLGSSVGGVNEPRQLLTPDLQAAPSEVPLGPSRAGVRGGQQAIRIRYGGGEKLIAADIDCTVDLDSGQKGVHMSRFPELFEEAIEEVVIGEALLVEQLAEHIARSEEHTSELQSRVDI